MEFLRGNKAIRDHEDQGKELHLFTKTRKSFVRYEGHVEYATHRLVEGVPDRNGNPRVTIIFQLDRVD